MANMFRCVLASGGALILTVTCDSAFAGQTITCTDGTTTLTQNCPSTSPYTVEFRIPNSGTWVISSGTASTSVTIPSSAELHDIPNGSTVTPTNNIQIWLHCANIWDKAYTSISQVLADSTTLSALIADSNAVSYMVRSTTWASSVCANQTAMFYIGLDNYCADTLLADSTWLNAICNSTYFESVLNVKVPTMTSDTAPYGEAIKSSESSSYQAYKAFDNSASTKWIANNNTNAWIGYDFGRNTSVKFVYVEHDLNNKRISKYKIQGSDDKNTWVDESNVITANVGTSSVNGKDYDIITINNGKRYHRLLCLERGTTSYDVGLVTLQFYGRSQS